MTRKKTTALLLYAMQMRYLKNPTLQEIINFFDSLVRRKIKFTFKTVIGVKNLVNQMVEKKILNKLEPWEKPEEIRFLVGNAGYKIWKKDRSFIEKAADALHKAGRVCRRCGEFSFFEI